MAERHYVPDTDAEPYQPNPNTPGRSREEKMLYEAQLRGLADAKDAGIPIPEKEGTDNG